MQDLATYEFSVDGASSEAVAKVIADPKTWVTLMGMPEETVPELLGSGSDFKCVRDDGKTCYMTNVVSKEGDREGDKVFAYTTSLTHTDLGDAGLAAPIFTVKHEFSMSSSSNGCVVKRVCTDFEQNEMLEVDLGSMLKGGMITKENATLVALCTASAQQDSTTPAAAERKVMQDLATYEFSVDGASSEAVAKVIADPKTWVTLMGMPEETVPELLGSGSDFKCVRDDGKTCYMTNVVSKEGDREGDKVFAYTTSLTHTDLGDAGLAAPIFTVKHEFSMSSSSNGCVVKRVCTDFEQNEMLEVD